MSDLQLPDRPSLDHLKRQARSLQQAQGLKLSSAQRALAKQYGFRDWTELRAAVLNRRSEIAVDDALEGKTAPDLSGAEPLFRLLRGDASNIDPLKPLPPRDWPPILYVTFSKVSTPEARRAATKDLLERGADPNASWIHPQYPDPPQTPIAAATYIHRDAKLIEILLQHGANPQDCEGLYHGTEEDGYACLRLLLAAGGSPKGANALAHMLDRDDPDGLQLILDHYGEPDDELSNGLHHAIVRGRDGEHIRRLLAHGADENFARNGLRPAIVARLYGNESASAALSLPDDLTTSESWLLDALEGRDVIALTEPMPAAELALTILASQDNAELVKKLVAAGVPVDSKGDGDRTALGEAAWFGAPNAVQALIELGADLTVRDKFYNALPFNWAVAGAYFRVHPDGNHVACAKLFHDIDAPGDREWFDEISRENPAMREAIGLAPIDSPSASEPLVTVVTGSRGRGSNLRALHAALPQNVRRVVAPSADTPAAEFAQSEGLDLRIAADEEQLIESVRGSDLVVLAGFMKRYPQAALDLAPTLNVHPSLLPEFGGKGMYGHHVHEAVLRSGVTETGCTVHRVTAEYDEGPPLLQLRCEVRPDDSVETLADRVLALEHEALVKVVKEELDNLPS